MITRIKKIMEEHQMTPSQFAEEIEINRSTLTHLFSGRNQPSLDIAKKILNAFPEISTEWLIMGVGPEYRQETDYGIEPSEEQILDPGQAGAKQEEPDLFTIPAEIKDIVKDRKISTPVEIPAPVNKTRAVRNRSVVSSVVKKEKSNSGTTISDRIVERIILIYNDQTFECLNLFQEKD